MLTLKELKEFAATLTPAGQGYCEPLVFAPPYDTILKSDLIIEMFFPAGCVALSNYLKDTHDYLVSPDTLEDWNFSKLFDMINGPKLMDFSMKGFTGKAIRTFEPPESTNLDWPVPNPTTLDDFTKVPEYVDGGFVNPLWVKDLLHKESRDIMVRKNHDYRGGSNDPYANFRGSREFDIDPVVGILLRCQDKFKRIKTFVEKGELMVKDESIKDAVLDVHNYMDLIYGLIKEAQEGGNNASK